jgi:N6-L-threonylcarbamoyladenine synthase
MEKLHKADTELNIKHLAISGGVSANKGLRAALINISQTKDYQVFIPPIEYCTDNAAMIAITGYYKYINGIYANQTITPVARYPLA